MPQPVCHILRLPGALRIQSTHLIHLFFVKIFFFWMQTILKVFVGCFTPLFLVCVLFFEYWSGVPFPSPQGLSDPELEPGSPAL